MFKLIHRLFREELVDMVKEADKRKNGKIDYKCKHRVTIKEWNKVINWFDKVKLLKVKLLLFAYHLGHNVTHPFSLIIIKWVPENMYTFSIMGHIVNVYKFSGTHFNQSLM